MKTERFFTDYDKAITELNKHSRASLKTTQLVVNRKGTKWNEETKKNEPFTQVQYINGWRLITRNRDKVIGEEDKGLLSKIINMVIK
jgi:hypothetical protein